MFHTCWTGFAVAVVSTTPFSGASNWQDGWSDSKKDWCCLVAFCSVTCDTCETKQLTVLTFESEGASVQSVQSVQPAVVISLEGCRHAERGCVKSTTSSPYDCLLARLDPVNQCKSGWKEFGFLENIPVEATQHLRIGNLRGLSQRKVGVATTSSHLEKHHLVELTPYWENTKLPSHVNSRS